MFGRRATLVTINRYLDSYQQNESLYPKVFKNLSSTFLKAVKKDEVEVAQKLEQGNPDDHARHEEYMLSFIPEPLKTQVYSHVNRGLNNAHTITELKKIMSEDSWNMLVESLQQVVKLLYVQENNCIFDPNDPASEKWAGIILLRHGEGYFVENGAHCDLKYQDCIDMLGVTDHAFANQHEIAFERVQIVSRTPCLVGVITFAKLIDTVKYEFKNHFVRSPLIGRELDTSQKEIDNVASFLLARRIRLEQERKRREKEEEMKRQETRRRHLADWREYLMAGDVKNVIRYLDNGFDVNTDIGVSRDKPIIIAMASNSVDLIRLLCDRGADLNAVNENGTTALHITCQNGWIGGIQQLIDRGAKLLQDKQGNTPLHLAAQQGNREVISYFINLKAEGKFKFDWNLRNFEGDKVVDCCMDLELKRLIVPKGVQGYSFDR